MTTSPLALLLAAGFWAWLLGAYPGADDGRRGNRHYADGDYAQAVLAYAAGAEVLGRGGAEPSVDDRAIGSLLTSNASSALYQLEQYDRAAEGFGLAAATATEAEVAAAAQYGLGLALARQEQYDAALDAFAQALRLRPDFPEAAYNWEWVRRQMPDEPPPEDESQPEPPEPSTFAEELKAQADELVGQRRYREAQELMLDGLEQDSTVGAYADFTERLGAVADIDEL